MAHRRQCVTLFQLVAAAVVAVAQNSSVSVTADLVVGGNFYMTGITTENLIRWDSAAWIPSPPPATNGAVASLLFYRVTREDGWHTSYIVAGGDFVTIDGVAANRVARWDGASWTALGTGMDSTVKALLNTTHGIFAAGAFLSAGGTPATRVAVWDEQQWHPVGAGIAGGGPFPIVDALVHFDNDIVAAGSFSQAGTVTALNVARWNGAAWSALGAGLNGWVHALIVFNGQLLAGGAFTASGADTTIQYASAWNGNAWTRLANGMNGAVFALALFGESLVVGGSFTTWGALCDPALAACGCVGVLSRQGAWGPVPGASQDGLGICYSVYTAAVYDGELVVGGYFYSNIDKAMNSIAVLKLDQGWRGLDNGVIGIVNSLAVFTPAVNSSPLPGPGSPLEETWVLAVTIAGAALVVLAIVGAVAWRGYGGRRRSQRDVSAVVNVEASEPSDLPAGAVADGNDVVTTATGAKDTDPLIAGRFRARPSGAQNEGGGYGAVDVPTDDDSNDKPPTPVDMPSAAFGGAGSLSESSLQGVAASYTYLEPRDQQRPSSKRA